MLQDMGGPPSCGATAANSDRNSPTRAVLRVRDCSRVNAATRSTPAPSGLCAIGLAPIGTGSAPVGAERRTASPWAEVHGEPTAGLTVRLCGGVGPTEVQ